MSVELRFMPCVEFELSIHEFVDGELPQPDSKSLLVHLELCENCRTSIESLRQQIRVHRDSVDFEKIVSGFDKDAFFKTLSGTLLSSNVERMATLLYELGKAYFVSGNDSKLVTFLQRKAVSIARASAEGRRLAKETADLAVRAGGAPRKTAQSLRRTQQMFRGRETARKGARIGASSGRTSLDNARRFLEECLILSPAHAAARLYLGVYFHRVDRPDEAIAEYRRILDLPNLEPTMRVMTLQALGNAFAYQKDYPRAIEYFEEIRRTGIVEKDPKFFTILVSLAMFHAKVGQLEQSTAAFGELVTRFPSKVAEARATLEKAEVFCSLLRSHASFRNDLVRRYPVLFAG